LGDHALGGTIDRPNYQLTIGRECCGMVQLLLERHAKKRSWPWHASWRSICGRCAPADSAQSNLD